MHPLPPPVPTTLPATRRRTLTLEPVPPLPHSTLHPTGGATGTGADCPAITLPLLDDGTVDMGTSFDLFDVASHPFSPLITGPDHVRSRAILRSCMVEAGFTPDAVEWWHFTLREEPFPTTSFDFDVV